LTGALKALAWRHGVASVQALGGMAGLCVFLLPDGRQISPFHIARWASEPVEEATPGILRQLRGEWPCVPFGSDGDRRAADGWPASTATPTVDNSPHGFAANHEWSLLDGNAQQLELKIAYPEDHPIAELHRRISPDPDAAAIDFELEVTPRRDCVLPIGLHPVFRLPRKPETMRIEVDGRSPAQTYPGDPDVSSIFAPDQYAEDWHAIKLRDGSVIDPSRVPLPRHTEDVLQLMHGTGSVALWNTVEGYRVRLTWETEHFPSLMLWFSNFGRQAPPWSGRHLALGVEPICSALDLGPQISSQPNPISARGVPTAHRFVANQPFITRYRIAVEPAPWVLP
jgi:hypothetical protein